MLEHWVTIVSCSDWMEPCYDELPPAPADSVFTILGDAVTFAGWPVIALLALRVVAGVIALVFVAKHGRRGW